jgi:hypothetical protein
MVKWSRENNLIKINYMPFTYLPDEMALRLTQAVGPVTVLQPLDAMATVGMRALESTGELNFRTCPMIDTAQLERSVAAFTAWADLHKGQGGELAAFFKSREAQALRASEASPNQIRTHIRRQGKTEPEALAEPLLKAALFLCLAHTYDHQQDTLNMDLGSVQAMEDQFGRILGNAEEEAGPLGSPLLPAGADSADRGLYMTAQRLRAWARLTGCIETADDLYLTDSAAVRDHLDDVLPDLLRIGQWPVRSPGRQGPLLSIEDLSGMLAVLARSPDPQKADLSRFTPTTAASQGASVTLFALAGCPPQRMLSRLLKGAADSVVATLGAPAALNTLFGYISL